MLEDQNPVGAPPMPPVIEPSPTPTPSYEPAPTSAPNYRPLPFGAGLDFNRFNNTLSACRGSLGGNKGGLISFLLRLLQGNSGLTGEAMDYDSTGLGSYMGYGAIQVTGAYPQARYIYPDYRRDPAVYEENGFEPTEGGLECMGRLRDRIGQFRQWMGGGGRGRFKPVVQNWLAHSTDWATSAVEYPQAWPSQQMPQGPMNTYYQGQTFYPRLQSFTGRLRAPDYGGSYGYGYGNNGPSTGSYGYGYGNNGPGNPYGNGSVSPGYTYGGGGGGVASGGNSYYQPAN